MATPKPRVIPVSDSLSLAHDSGPPNLEFYIAGARLLEKKGRLNEAAQQYQGALKLDAKSLHALLGYARLLDRQDKLTQATQYYRQAVRHHPDSASAHNDLGLCYARRMMLRESLAELGTAVRLQPSKPRYHNNLATVLLELNRPTEAMKHLLAVNQPAVAHYNMGYLLAKQGNRDLAVKHFSKTLELDPSMAAARQWMEKLGARPPAGPASQESPASPQWTGIGQPRTQEPSRQTAAPTPAAIAPSPSHSASGAVRTTPSSPAAGDSFSRPMPPLPEDLVGPGSARTLLEHLPPVSAAYVPPSRW